MPSAPSRPWLSWLYTHNPFYAISAALMLFSVQAAYGTLEIGSINCWIMLGVLAGYTLTLAGIAVAIIRWGRVWDDARSLLLLLLLLFLAVSIFADDLFVKSTSPAAGAGLMLCGYLGSAVLSEVVLRGARIRLSWLLRGPYHLMLALFYAAPWWCTPELHPRSSQALEWTIFLFPVVAAGLFLLLIPAVRRGSAVVANHGTPWPWPWFPWTMFGVIAAAVALRSFVLAMTFGPTGPIWNGSTRTLSAINFSTIFGPWFLILPAFAIFWLILEGSIVSRNARLLNRVLAFAPALLAMALPAGNSPVFQSFLLRFTERCGSPLWLTAWLLVAFYARAWLARVPFAGMACCGALLLFTVVGPRTLSPSTFTIAQPWPLLAAGAIALIQGIRLRSSALSFGAAALLSAGLWLVLPQTLASDFRMTITFHTLWGAAIVLGLSFRDRFADLLRAVGAAMMPFTAFLALASPRADVIPMSWRLGYVGALTVLAMAIAIHFRVRWYRIAFGSIFLMAALAGTLSGYRMGVVTFGRRAMVALSWSVAALLVASLISARKANWLPMDGIGRWIGGNGSRPADPAGPLEGSPPSGETPV